MFSKSFKIFPTPEYFFYTEKNTSRDGSVKLLFQNSLKKNKIKIFLKSGLKERKTSWGVNYSAQLNQVFLKIKTENKN